MGTALGLWPHVLRFRLLVPSGVRAVVTNPEVTELTPIVSCITWDVRELRVLVQDAAQTPVMPLVTTAITSVSVPPSKDALRCALPGIQQVEAMQRSDMNGRKGARRELLGHQFGSSPPSARHATPSTISRSLS